MFVGALLLALLPALAGARPHRGLRQGHCPKSFPLAPAPHTAAQGPQGNHGNGRRGRRAVAIPPAPSVEDGEWYETGAYYAPLCPDGRRLDMGAIKQCLGGSCYDESVGQCTFVCTWNRPTPRPTGVPTQRPTFPIEETEHPLLLSLRGLPDQYRFRPDVRAAILRYMHEKVKYDLEDMDIGLSLVEVFSPGRLPGRPHGFPLTIKVRGPSDISDFALSYILQLMQDANVEIASNLRKLDYEAFRDLSLSVTTFDVNEIDATWDVVTGEPTPRPTPSPVAQDTVAVKGGGGDAMILDDTSSGTEWWVWLIVASILIFCCLCCVCVYCWRRRNNDAYGGKDAKSQQQVTMFFGQNPLPRRRRASLESEANEAKKLEERRRRKSRRSDLGSLRNSFNSRRANKRRESSNRHNNGDRSARISHKAHRTQSARTFAPPPVEMIREEDSSYDDVSTLGSVLPRELPRLAGAKVADEESASGANYLPIGYDPPEETANAAALTLYEPNPDASEPEGDKIDRKMSVFGSAALMSSIRREESERRQREAERSQQSARRSRMPRRNSIDRLRNSFQRWNRGDTDSPSDNEDEIYNPSSLHSSEIPATPLQSERLDQSEPEGLTCDELEAAAEEARRSKRKKKSGRKKKRHKERARKADVESGPVDINSLGSDENLPSIQTKEPESPRPHSNRGGLFASLRRMSSDLAGGVSSEEEILD